MLGSQVFFPLLLDTTNHLWVSGRSPVPVSKFQLAERSLCRVAINWICITGGHSVLFAILLICAPFR